MLIRVSGYTSILGNTGPMFLSTYGGKEVLVLPREKGGRKDWGCAMFYALAQIQRRGVRELQRGGEVQEWRGMGICPCSWSLCTVWLTGTAL